VFTEQHHLVSAESLINKFDIIEIDESTMSYPGITQLGKRIRHLTSDLGSVVFRRMLLNIAIGNTDDPLRNHAFMKQSSAADYTFSPGYDIVPQISLQGRMLSLSVLSEAPRALTISKPRRGAWVWPMSSPTKSAARCSR